MLSNESEHGLNTPNEKKILDISLSKDSLDENNNNRKLEKRKTIKNLNGNELNSNEIEMFGYLQKRRGGFGRHMPNAWQQRYFTLKDGIMYYYEDSGSDSRPRGKIDLKTENCDFMNGLVFEGAPTPYTMQIIPGGWEEKWKLCASTKEEMENWVTAIMKHITDETKRKPQQLNIRSYVSDDDDDDDHEAEEDDGPHLKLRGIPVSGGASVITPVSNSQNQTPSSSTSISTNQNQTSSSNNNDNNNNSQQQKTTSSSTTTIVSQNVNLGSTTTVVSNNNSSDIQTTTSSSSSSSTTTGAMATTATSTHKSSSTSTTAASNSGKGKRKLKLQTDASAENDDMEFITAITVVNLCLLFAYTTPHFLMSIFYIIVLNIVVARTLQLRSLRLVHQHHTMTLTHNAAIKALNESHQQAIHVIKESLLASTSKSDGNITNTVDIVSQIEITESETIEDKKSGPPPPGSTMVQVINALPPDVPTHTWNICDHSTFNVRVGPDYSKYKRKGPSAKPLYEAYAVDTFCAKNRIDNVAQFIKLENTDNINTNNEFVPPLLVVQIQLPSDAPPLFETIEDGPGWAIVMYFRITQETCNELKDLSTASPAVKLFAKYCQYAEKDPAWRGRFKVINFCSNLEEMGVPNVIMSYNAKPVLIRRTGSVFRGTGSSRYLEIDIHVHKFANLAKKSIHALSSRCSLMYMQIGFVIEGRTDEELPETLFACVGVNRPEEDKAEFLFDPPEDET